MNKICTSIEQSKKLLELGIDVNTADMYWDYDYDIQQEYKYCPRVMDEQFDDICIPAWSLTALVDCIKDKCSYFNVYRLLTDIYDIYQKEAIDACYEMILKLHELKLL